MILHTAAPKRILALAKDGACLALREASEGSHSEALLPQLKELLLSQHLSLNAIDLYVTTVGPGSLTGLRIGLATLKGLASVHPRPALPLSSLLVLAYPYLSKRRSVAVAMPARLGELAVALYGSLPEPPGFAELVSPHILPVSEYQAWLTRHEPELCLSYPQALGPAQAVDFSGAALVELTQRLSGRALEARSLNVFYWDSGVRGVKA